MKKKNLHPFDALEQYSHMYDFNIQIMDGDYNIFVSRDLFEIYSVGGDKTLKDAVDRVIEWILRVNMIERDNYLNY